MRERLLSEHFNSLIVEHIARFINDAVLSMRSVGIQSHVGDNAKRWEISLKRANRPLDEAIGIVSLCTIKRFSLGIGRRKQSDSGDV